MCQNAGREEDCVVDEMISVTWDDIAQVNEEFLTDRASAIAKNAVCAQGVRAVAKVPEIAARNTPVFDIEVKQGERTDQKRSGRCWMFAALNTFRVRTMRKFNLSNFEFSQAYPLYWDKLEKSNWFLENVIDTLDEPTDGRVMAFLLADPVSDGGQWDMFAALVKKYGVVPKDAMPETSCSSNTGDLDGYLTRYLRSCACQMRVAYAEGSSVDELRDRKKQMMGNVQTMLNICLGQPPATFDVRLRDKDDKLVLSGTYTPLEFFDEAVGIDIDDYVSIISAPTTDKPFMRTYTVSRLGNVIEAGGVRYLNLPPADLKAAAIAQLRAGDPVWFGCDVDQSFVRADGMMDLDALDIDGLFGFDVMAGFDKAARLDYGESLMTHAMVLEGVNFDAAGNSTLWKVENSWGKDRARDGFDSLTDAWFDEYVYQVVVDKKYLTDEQRETFDTMEPIVLEPWDPMGALA